MQKQAGFLSGQGGEKALHERGPMEGLNCFGKELRLYSLMNWEQINSSLAPQSRHLEIDCFTF